MVEANLDKIFVQLTGQVLAISAPTVVNGPTSRPAAVVIWSVDGKPFTFEDATRHQVWKGDAAIIAPHYVRALRAVDCNILSINYEPNHPWLPPLKQMVGDRGVLSIARERVSPFSREMHEAIVDGCSDCLEGLASDLAAYLTCRPMAHRPLDRRVAEILARLEAEIVEPPSLSELAEHACVSADRLSHLLATEIGIPFRSYVLWRKYRRALSLLHEGESLSWVAQAAGFYDQAHMTRTFLCYFGYTPSVIREQGLVLGRT